MPADNFNIITFFLFLIFSQDPVQFINVSTHINYVHNANNKDTHASLYSYYK